MKLSHILGVIVVVALLIAMLLPRYYLKQDFDPYVTVLSNQRSAFVFVGKSTTGEAGNALQLLAKTLLTIYPQPPVERGDLVVTEIRSNKVVTRTLNGFGYSGSAFPFHGDIYFSRGGDISTGPLLWKWDTGQFVTVERQEASRILGSFTFTDALIKSTGWAETRLRFTSGTNASSIPFEAGELKVILATDNSSENAHKVVKIKGDFDKNGEAIVAEVETRYLIVTGKEYRHQLQAGR